MDVSGACRREAAVACSAVVANWPLVAAVASWLLVAAVANQRSAAVGAK